MRLPLPLPHKLERIERTDAGVGRRVCKLMAQGVWQPTPCPSVGQPDAARHACMHGAAPARGWCGAEGLVWRRGRCVRSITGPLQALKGPVPSPSPSLCRKEWVMCELPDATSMFTSIRGLPARGYRVKFHE